MKSLQQFFSIQPDSELAGSRVLAEYHTHKFHTQYDLTFTLVPAGLHLI